MKTLRNAVRLVSAAALLCTAQLASAALVFDISLNFIDGDEQVPPQAFGQLVLPSELQIPFPFGAVEVENATCGFEQPNPDDLDPCMSATLTLSDWEGFGDINEIGEVDARGLEVTGTGLWLVNPETWGLDLYGIGFVYDFGQVFGTGDDAFRYLEIQLNTFTEFGNLCATTSVGQPFTEGVPQCFQKEDRLLEFANIVPVHEKVPVPGSLFLFGLGIAALAAARRHRA